jgi:hypothetical protein
MNSERHGRRPTAKCDETGSGCREWRPRRDERNPGQDRRAGCAKQIESFKMAVQDRQYSFQYLLWLPDRYSNVFA